MRTPRAHALAAAVSAVLLLAGCSGGDEPDDPKATWTPTSTPEDPSTSPAVATEPELPSEATKATEAGARAFIHHYWDLINYAQLTGDVSALRKLSAASCDGCAAGIRAIRRHYVEGGRLEGGRNVVRLRELEELRTDDDDAALAYRADFVVKHAQQSIISSDGTRDRRESGKDRYTAYMLWVANGWRLDVLEIEP